MTAQHPDPMREMQRLISVLHDLHQPSPTLPQCLEAAAQKRSTKETERE